MTKKRVELINGEIRDLPEEKANWAVEHELGKIVGTVYDLSQDFDEQLLTVAVNA